MPYRDVEQADGSVRRVVYSKHPGGHCMTKRESLAYWAGKETGTMATTKKQGKRDDWNEVPSELNIWSPKSKGQSVTGIVTQINPAGKFGLQVKIMEEDGTIWTLPAHKVLQGRLESVPGGCKVMRTVLEVTYTGTGKSEKWPTPMALYAVRYRNVTPDDKYGVGDDHTDGAVPF